MCEVNEDEITKYEWKKKKTHKLKQILYCQMKVLLELPRFKCGTLLLPLCAFFTLEKKKKDNNNNSLWCVYWRGPDLLWTREWGKHTDVFFFFFLSSPSLITYCLKPRQSFAAVTLLPQAIDRIKSFTLNGFGKWKLKNLLKRSLFFFFFFRISTRNLYWRSRNDFRELHM